jgi:hypothetical protein
MKVIASIVVLGCFLTIVLADEAESPTLRVRAAMKNVEAGKFLTPSGPVTSGWLMTNENHQVLQRSFLQAQGQAIIPVGAEAVPELIKWLDHRNMHVRYIAHYCLEQITGEEPYFPHFATLKQLRSEGYLKEAVKCWSEWYAKKKPNQPPGANSRHVSRERSGSFGVAAVAQAGR